MPFDWQMQINIVQFEFGPTARPCSTVLSDTGVCNITEA